MKEAITMDENRRDEYKRPEISIEFYKSNNAVTTSGYSGLDEGFGDEVYW